VLCTGKLKYLLNVECDQEFVVQDKTALASEQAVRDRQSYFSRWNFLLSYGLNPAAFKNDIRGENLCL
jgi:hypothetical protein